MGVARRLGSRRATRVGLLFLALFLALGVWPTSWLPHDPTEVNLGLANRPGLWAGNWSQPLGTDFLGRDLLSRSVYAARLTLVIGLGAVTIATLVGTVVGLLAGYFAGWVDEVLSWLIDVQLAFPMIALAVAVIAVLGGSLTSLIGVLAATSWFTTARVVRAQVLAVKASLFIEAAGALGAGSVRTVFRHILPNVVSPILAVATFEMARLVLTESALSFLGLGVSSPQTTWGAMIGDGRAYVYESWWVATVPGLLIAALVIAFNFVSDGLRDAMDPTSYASSGRTGGGGLRSEQATEP